MDLQGGLRGVDYVRNPTTVLFFPDQRAAVLSSKRVCVYPVGFIPGHTFFAFRAGGRELPMGRQVSAARVNGVCKATRAFKLYKQMVVYAGEW